MSAPKVLDITNSFAIALCSVDQADSCQSSKYAAQLLDAVQMYAELPTASTEPDINDPPSLSEIYDFHKRIVSLQSYKDGKKLFLCCGNDPKNITFNAVLAGGFFILSQQLGLDEVNRAFEPLSCHLVDFDDQLTVRDCWSALHYASSRCGWLNHDGTTSDPEPGRLDMEEYAHYDNPLNGGFHSLVPDKLLVFNRPDDTPGGADWADVGAERRFSAAYYALVFGDFDVRVVVRVTDEDGAAPYDAGAFAEHGIAVVDLPLGGGGVPTLAQIDRFLTLARQAPGAVAVHGGGGGLGAAGTLIAAHLIGAHRFQAAEAVAWVRMVHPAGLPGRRRRPLVAAEAGITV